MESSEVSSAGVDSGANQTGYREHVSRATPKRGVVLFRIASSALVIAFNEKLKRLEARPARNGAVFRRQCSSSGLRAVYFKFVVKNSCD